MQYAEDGKTPVLNLAGARDPACRATWEEQEARFPEVYRPYFDPLVLRDTERPTPEMQIMLEDVFGEAAKGDHPKIFWAMHPHWKRWSLFERCHIDGTETCAWVWACHEDKPYEGYMPPDVDHKWQWECQFFEIGDFKLPEKWELELVRMISDKQFGTVEERLAKAREHYMDKKRQEDSDWEAKEHDFCSQYWRLAQLEANDGIKTWCHTTDLDECHKVKLEMRNQEEFAHPGGFLVRTKKDSRIGEKIKAEIKEWAEQEVGSLLGKPKPLTEEERRKLGLLQRPQEAETVSVPRETETEICR